MLISNLLKQIIFFEFFEWFLVNFNFCENEYKSLVNLQNI